VSKDLKRSILLLPAMASLLLSACASQSQLDTALADNQQLRQQVAADQAHIKRLQEAVKYTVNSDLLFTSGGWEISAAGKDIIAKMAKVLAPEQQEKIMVYGYTDNTPVGASLRQQGITSNQILSQKRAETVMQYMISQGVKPELVAAQGFGEADPIASNSTAQGRAQNRRVEVTLAGGES
jgi:chemotaxis protein MotB